MVNDDGYIYPLVLSTPLSRNAKVSKTLCTTVWLHEISFSRSYGIYHGDSSQMNTTKPPISKGPQNWKLLWHIETYPADATAMPCYFGAMATRARAQQETFLAPCPLSILTACHAETAGIFHGSCSSHSSKVEVFWNGDPTYAIVWLPARPKCHIWPIVTRPHPKQMYHGIVQ